MTIHDQTKYGLAASVTAGSMVTASSGKGERIIGVATSASWNKSNAFALSRDLIFTVISFALWVAAAAGLLYWSDQTGNGWTTWAGVIMLAVACLFPIALLALYIKVASAGVLVRLYRPLSAEWMKAGETYRRPSVRLVKYVLVYTLCLPLFLIKDALRVVRFAFSKLVGKNVKFGSARDVFNMKLIEELNISAKTLGPEKADYLHYVAWVTMNMPATAATVPTHDEWRAGIRKAVVSDLRNKYGPILTS